RDQRCGLRERLWFQFSFVDITEFPPPLSMPCCSVRCPQRSWCSVRCPQRSWCSVRCPQRSFLCRIKCAGDNARYSTWLQISELVCSRSRALEQVCAASL